MTTQRLLLTSIAGACVASLSVALAVAGPASLPFNESFNTSGSDASFATDYPAFTTTGALSRSVDAGGILRLGAGGVPASTFTTVTPSFAPASALLIKIDMGFDGPAGSGAAALKLGANVINFHPGYNGPPGAFRVDGPGGGSNQDMGFVPTLGVLHHVEILSSPSGLFNVKVTDGANPTNVYAASFTNAGSYGGEIGPAAVGAASGMFDNFSITAVPEPTSLGLGLAGVLWAAGATRRRVRRVTEAG